jgi:hypothetical protein
MPDVTYKATDEKDLDLAAALREKQRAYHVARSKYFGDQITEKTLAEVNVKLRARASGGLLLDLVKDNHTAGYVGYCITFIDQEQRG